MYSRKICGLALVTFLVNLVGCTIVGKWQLSSVDPTAAERDVQYHNITFQKDGSFYAEAKEGTIQTTSGTYSYENGTLHLKEQDGESHTYDAKMPDGNHLALQSFWEGKKLKLKYERRE